MQTIAYFTVQHHDIASVYKFNNLDITVILHDALTMLAILYC